VEGFGTWYAVSDIYVRADMEGRDSMVAMFTILCQVEADLSSCGCITRRQESDGSGVYYAAFFDLVLLFGLTEFKAQIAWDENVSHSICSLSCSAHFQPLQGEEKR
jgi:hypothetical protein